MKQHGHQHDDEHHGEHAHHAHGHTHGVVDPSFAATDRGLWALKWFFVSLMVTAVIQVVVVVLSGSIGLLADTIHNFADAATAIPLGIAFWLARRGKTTRSNRNARDVLACKWLRAPATIDGEGLVDAGAANPFRLPRRQ